MWTVRRSTCPIYTQWPIIFIGPAPRCTTLHMYCTQRALQYDVVVYQTNLISQKLHKQAIFHLANQIYIPNMYATRVLIRRTALLTSTVGSTTTVQPIVRTMATTSTSDELQAQFAELRKFTACDVSQLSMYEM